MPSTDDVHSLTLLEQAILAQLSSNKSMGLAKLMTGLARVIAPDDRAAFKRTEMESVLLGLRKRGFITG